MRAQRGHYSALLVLLTAVVLGVRKPKGMTPYGWRKQQESVQEGPPPTR